MKNDTCFSSMC